MFIKLLKKQNSEGHDLYFFHFYEYNLFLSGSEGSNILVMAVNNWIYSLSILLFFGVHLFGWKAHDDMVFQASQML